MGHLARDSRVHLLSYCVFSWNLRVDIVYKVHVYVAHLIISVYNIDEKSMLLWQRDVGLFFNEMVFFFSIIYGHSNVFDFENRNTGLRYILLNIQRFKATWILCKYGN